MQFITGDSSMFDNLSDIINLKSPCASPSYSPILKPETIKKFNEARLQQAYEEAELLLDNTNICNNEHEEAELLLGKIDIYQDESGMFKIRDDTFDQDPDLPSNLNYEPGDPRLGQWREDLCLGPFMDPFTGELERETALRAKMKRAREEAEHKQNLKNLQQMTIAADDD